jgi:hypothetical protein
MPALNAETDPFRLNVSGRPHGACGYQWTNDKACDPGTEHLCSRIRADHRSHLCSCQAVELRTATHLRRAASGPEAAASESPASTVDILDRRR